MPFYIALAFKNQQFEKIIQFSIKWELLIKQLKYSLKIINKAFNIKRCLEILFTINKC